MRKRNVKRDRLIAELIARGEKKQDIAKLLGISRMSVWKSQQRKLIHKHPIDSKKEKE